MTTQLESIFSLRSGRTIKGFTSAFAIAAYAWSGVVYSQALTNTPAIQVADPSLNVTYVVKPTYRSTTGFSEGLAGVKVGSYPSGKYGYINRQGQEVIPVQFDSAGSLSDGVAMVRIGDRDTGLYGVISVSKSNSR
jgi:hypothetical protein